MSDKAKLKINDSQIDLNLIKGSENEIGIDISSLRSKSNVITLDPGYKNTGSCKSGITSSDREKGVLRYRGYSIDELDNIL